ncbi:MAG: 2-hydroxyacyl-CoA dehydratase family protein [Thermodesulfobacteriota bacterium]
MRAEVKEYNFDWMMNRGVAAASLAADGTVKERDLLLRYVPYFKGPLEAILGEGEPGAEFLKMMAKFFDNLLTAHQKGKKIAATTFCFSPAILYAVDAVPVTFEILTALASMMWKRGAFDYLDFACEAGLTETSCSSQRGAIGAYFAGLGEEPDFMVCDTPGVCDTNANAFAFASNYLNKPFFQLNYPQRLNDGRTSQYHIDDFKALITFLEEQTGNKMDYDRLKRVLLEVEKQDTIIADMEDMQMAVPSPVPPLYNMFIYAGRFICSGLPEYTTALEKMRTAVRRNLENGICGLKSGVEKKRLFMCYIDHYTVDMTFWKWLDYKGLSHLGSILSKTFMEGTGYTKDIDGSAYKMDTSSEEAMLNSIAQLNARLPMVRSIRGPYDQPNMWLDETLAVARAYKADCIIYNGTPGCRNTWGMVKPFARDLEKMGYPTFIMYDDAFDDRVESWENTRARLEEFFTVRGLL